MATKTSEMAVEPPAHIRLLAITDRFLVDLECIREMYSSVLPLLHKQDEERQKAVNAMLNDQQRITVEAEDQNEEGGNGGECDESEGEQPVRLTISGPDAEQLIANIRKIKRAESLFGKQTVVSVVSRFDEFLGALLQIALEKNPAWLKTSDKTITYKDLIDLRSIESAVQGVISKEVEQLLRGSHEEQIDYLDEKLKLGIRDHFESLPTFLEVAERRNLFVHTGGKVSQQYLERCKNFGCKTETTLDDGQLDVNEEYFQEAFSVFFELGLRVGQAAHRRLFSTELNIADASLNKLAIKFLNSGDYRLTEIITNFDLAIPGTLRSDNPEYAYYARINRAIAQKRQGKDFEEGLQGVHWKVFHPKYQLCLHVLREEYNEAREMMRSEVIKKEVGVTGFRTWPIFRDFRATSQFKEAYKEIFGDEYAPDPERDAPTIAEQEEVIQENASSQNAD